MKHREPSTPATRIRRWLGMACVAALLGACGQKEAEVTEIVVAAVNNGQIIDMQRLTPHFEKAHPDIKVRWVTLEEGILRQRVTQDIATKGGQFDLMTLGSYEVPLWSKQEWLLPVETDAAWDADDLLPVIRDGVSHAGKLYGLPFYGEASILMYRRDLAEKVGFSMPAQPSWDEVREFAAAAHDPGNGVYGICLRGKPGWGENMAFVSTLVNTFGGQWFDMQWKPRIDSPAWNEAIQFYVDLLNNYGPPGSTSNNFNEIIALFNEGRCAVWADASSAALWVSDPASSNVANEVAFAAAPVAVTPKGASWVFSWNLAIPASTRKADAAKTFARWATSREYVALVAQEKGWHLVPTGTRRSTYENPAFREAAPFARAEQQALAAITGIGDSTLPPSPYVGIQYAVIPEFQAIGTATGQQISAALAGQISVEEALKAAQTQAEREMERAGYYQ